MFGGGGLHGFDDLGNHMQRMNNMMNSFFGGRSPFGNDPFMNGGNPAGQTPSMGLMPFDGGFPSPMQMPLGMSQMMSQMMGGMGGMGGMPGMGMLSMPDMAAMSSSPNGHSFSSSSVNIMTTGPDGKPMVYRSSESAKTGPGGIRETKKSVCDSRTGVKKLAIGRHIGDRGHIKEKEQNVLTGAVEENDEYINLEEEEEPEFGKEWQAKTRQFRSRGTHQAIAHHQPTASRNEPQYLALPPASSTESSQPREETRHKKNKSHRSAPYSKRKEKTEKNKNQE